MSTRGSLRATLALSAAAAATTWVAMLSWRPFTELPGRYLGPLLVVGAVVAGTGALARWGRLPAATVVLVQVVVSAAVTCLLLTGYPVPIGPGWVETQAVFTAAVDSANQYAPPVPSDVPGVHPLLVAGGLACFLLVDVLVATLRRVSLAGLPLLTIYSVPVGLIGGGLSWWVFALTAAGFLVTLYLHEDEQVTRWGRTLGDGADPGAVGFDVRTGRSRASAGAIGGAATVLAVAVPLVIPTMDVHLLDIGPGAGGDDEISLSNPMADLRRDLVRGEDVPVLRLTTDDPDPSYLRISVLKAFNGDAWSSGDRDVPLDNLADGDLPALVGVEPGVNRRAFDYRVAVDDDFESTWLPTMATSTRVLASGDWRYDVQTRDFLSGDDDLDTAGLRYSMSAVELEYDAVDMARAPSLGGMVSQEFTELPSGIPSAVRNLALQVTREAPTRFEKAVALQRWFRETGGFTYTLRQDAGNGTDELVEFLQEEREGYCEQFAAAMTVMARMLGIPARVAVGFLSPQPVGVGTFEYSTHDLHAWPELFFPGSGWVRFEPTPSRRVPAVPRWTQQEVPAFDPGTDPSDDTSAGADTPDRADDAEPLPAEEEQEEDVAAADDGRAWLVPLLVGLLVLALLVALALLPRTLRARRRERRLSAGPEPAWAELRDVALDLRLAWPESRSPRQTRDWLVDHFGAPTDEASPERPARGAHLAPDAVHALDRVVRALEVLRYSPRSDEAAGTLRAEVQTVTDALVDGAPRGARRLAGWFPRSVLRPGRSPRLRPADGPVETRYGGVVDSVRG